MTDSASAAYSLGMSKSRWFQVRPTSGWQLHPRRCWHDLGGRSVGEGAKDQIGREFCFPGGSYAQRFPVTRSPPHAVQTPGVAALREGLLDRLIATGSPPIHTHT